MQLIPRQDRTCYDCDTSQQLSCSSDCPAGACNFLYPIDCYSCPQAICQPQETGSGDEDGGGVNVGAIAGGVIGGVVLIAVATYLVWRFCIKPKRAESVRKSFEPDSSSGGAIEKGDDYDDRMTHRSSTHTVHSIASTVLTRASNIIQIAYIPGVTNRASPSSPTVLVPPVPPIPMHHAEANRASGQEESHFFVPGDLRDSTYSGISGYSDRTSYARTSYAPRSSVASTIYGKQAPVVHPAQTGMRAKPTMVSVKSVGNSPATTFSGATPPMPNLDLEKFDVRPQSTMSNFSVGSTFLNTATTARAQVVKVGGGLKKIEVGSTKSDAGSTNGQSNPPSPGSPDGSVHSLGAITLTASDRTPPSVDQGPFSDPSPSAGLGVVMEEAEEPHSNRNLQRLGSYERENSPFADQHVTRS
jgi:hypothetical protein